MIEIRLNYTPNVRSSLTENTARAHYNVLPLGPCHHGKARPQVAGGKDGL